MPMCEHPWYNYGVAHWRQELHATISSVVVSRYTRLDSFVVKHIALFLWTTNLEAVFVLLLLLMCIYSLTPGATNLHIQLPRFPLPRFQRPRWRTSTEKNTCSIARFPCGSTAFWLNFGFSSWIFTSKGIKNNYNNKPVGELTRALSIFKRPLLSVDLMVGVYDSIKQYPV